LLKRCVVANVDGLSIFLRDYSGTVHREVFDTTVSVQTRQQDISVFVNGRIALLGAGQRESNLLTSKCRIVSAVDSGYPDNRTKFEGDIKMVAFYVVLAVLGAAFINQAAAAQARKRASLQPVRIRSTDHRQR
jgi:hypothetical protein